MAAGFIQVAVPGSQKSGSAHWPLAQDAPAVVSWARQVGIVPESSQYVPNTQVEVTSEQSPLSETVAPPLKQLPTQHCWVGSQVVPLTTQVVPDAHSLSKKQVPPAETVPTKTLAQAWALAAWYAAFHVSVQLTVPNAATQAAA